MRAPPQADCVKADRAFEVPPLCFTVTGFNRDRAKATLTALGVKNLRPLNSNSVHMDDPVGYDVQLSGLDETAFNSGGSTAAETRIAQACADFSSRRQRCGAERAWQQSVPAA